MTHGCIKVVGKNGEVVWLHTYHTGQDAKLVIENVFEVVLENRSYLRLLYQKEDVKSPYQFISDTFKYDGSLCDWFEYASFVASLIIASAPMRYHVVSLTEEFTPDWERGADTPTVIECGLEWKVTYEDGTKKRYNVPAEIANKLVKGN